jgi:hypothetical protein
LAGGSDQRQAQRPSGLAHLRPRDPEWGLIPFRKEQVRERR